MATFKIVERVGDDRNPTYTLFFEGGNHIAQNVKYAEVMACIEALVRDEDVITEEYSNGNVVEYSGLEFKEH